MKYILERDFYISAAHYLEGHERCGEMHGHNWKITVRLQASTRQLYEGMVMDFKDLKEIVETILKRLDHKVINEVIERPTAENMAYWLYTSLDGFMKARVHSVTVQETRDCRVTYEGGV